MSLSPDRLKRAYRDYLRGIVPSTRSECPPPGDLMFFFKAQATRRFKARILDHVSRCGPCAEEFASLLEVDRAAREFTAYAEQLCPERGRPRHRRKFSSGFWGLGRLAAAGVGLAALAAGLLVLTDRGPVAPPGPAMTLRSAGTILLVHLDSPSGIIRRNEIVAFRWRPSGTQPLGACVVSVFDDSLLRIWESPPVSTLSVNLPAAVQSTLLIGRTYYWGLSLVSGNSDEASDLEAFRIEEDDAQERGEAKSSNKPVRK